MCTHCLYNGAVGWSHLTHSQMRRLTLMLGIIGGLLAIAGVWSLFLDWLNLLGIFVPPIGAVIITDQLLLGGIDRPRRRGSVPRRGVPGLGGRRRGGDAGPCRRPRSGEAITGMLVGGAVFAAAPACAPRRRGANLERRSRVNGLGGLNKSADGVVIGLVQLKLERIDTPDDLARQTRRIVELVAQGAAQHGDDGPRGLPEYALHGLSMSTDPAIMCRRDGRRSQPSARPASTIASGAASPSWSTTRTAIPTMSGSIIDDARAPCCLYYRKLHPWVPVEPWEPGDLGIPVIDGPNGCKLALIICHDGMFPEMARECAYKGAEIMLRTAGYTAPVRESWRFTNQANAFHNLMVTANVCMCGSDGTFDSMGEGDGVRLRRDASSRMVRPGGADEIITAEVRPDLVREASDRTGASRTTSTSSAIAAMPP